ncbi:MAG: bifunctional phosphopantothenoylcysteine decarboxylase/phosphopantothenate--cysteine ligase CoaBC [Candidatus Marinimicrobia bacterium]|nr:bifunctional phosphopantothenoylcysteine decarboxylase/phosphopantothenate--cysteine ligase CoaBC [Candidatus Neomarinimicrobiota bacterium]
MGSVLKGKRILVGVCGSIAAYKASELVRTLRKDGADVTVAMTEAATQFIGPATFAAFTEHPVMLEQFPDDPGSGIAHVDIADRFDMVVVAPATANIMGKAAHAVADELLATILNIVECPVIFVPAMNYRMWRNDATQAAVTRLRASGKLVIDPDVGDLATLAVGAGRYPETERIVAAITEAFSYSQRLTGKKVLVTAGPTREPIDPVRYISNRSSGKMGYALAAAARAMGAEVALVSGPTALEPPFDCELLKVETADEMLAAVKARIRAQDFLIMAAAVADFQPVDPAREKIRRGSQRTSIGLKAAPDIIKEIRGRFDGTLVAFSLQANDDHQRARQKMLDKGAQYIVVNSYNEPEAGFESDNNHVWVISHEREPVELPLAPKKIIARQIWEEITRSQE